MKKVFIILTVLFIASCASDSIRVHGNMIRDEDLVYVEQGETSKNDMIMMFGQPTTKSTFDEETWYYMGQTVEYRSLMKPNIIERKIVEVCFNEEGIVKSIKGYELGDGSEIEPCPDETRSLGTEQNVLQQLIGNIGKFNSTNNDFK
jgi:outer membrane protein assembly factor BamE (lipoprotein component of BamABCDE complex)